jgi:hypothetical protein
MLRYFRTKTLHISTFVAFFHVGTTLPQEQKICTLLWACLPLPTFRLFMTNAKFFAFRTKSARARALSTYCIYIIRSIYIVFNYRNARGGAYASGIVRFEHSANRQRVDSTMFDRNTILRTSVLTKTAGKIYIVFKYFNLKIQ